MKAKKNKDLESELLNDLLAEAGSLPTPDLGEMSESSAINKTASRKLEGMITRSAINIAPDADDEAELNLGSKPSNPVLLAPVGAAEPNEPIKDPDADANEASDATIRLSASKVLPANLKAPKNETNLASLSLNRPNRNQHQSQDRIAIRPTSAGSLGSADASLVLSENVRIAQQRIFELEEEIGRIRAENEQLAAAGETIRKRADELQTDNEFMTKKLVDLKERMDSEREILEGTAKAKDRELKELQMKNQEFEMRLSTNLQKIRVRERELENRLELVKMESTAVVRSKDELILDLKRQIDQLSLELDNYRNKGQELNRQIGEKQEMLRRTVKALRLALSMLEGGADDQDGGKKAG